MSAKKPPVCELTLKFENGASFSYPLDQLLASLGLIQTPDEIQLSMRRGDVRMDAKLQPKESEYPGITVDAYTSQSGDIYLGNFEFPSEDYPTRISARLYAGCHKYETDEPIAIATHEISDDARVIYRSSKHGDPRKHMHKLVYIDRKLAEPRTWCAAGEDDMPEHVEDESQK